MWGKPGYLASVVGPEGEDGWQSWKLCDVLGTLEIVILVSQLLVLSVSNVLVSLFLPLDHIVSSLF